MRLVPACVVRSTCDVRALVSDMEGPMDELEEQARDEALEECEQQHTYELDYERRND